MCVRAVAAGCSFLRISHCCARRPQFPRAFQHQRIRDPSAPSVAASGLLQRIQHAARPRLSSPAFQQLRALEPLVPAPGTGQRRHANPVRAPISNTPLHVLPWPWDLRISSALAQLSGRQSQADKFLAQLQRAAWQQDCAPPPARLHAVVGRAPCAAALMPLNYREPSNVARLLSYEHPGSRECRDHAAHRDH